MGVLDLNVFGIPGFRIKNYNFTNVYVSHKTINSIRHGACSHKFGDVFKYLLLHLAFKLALRFNIFASNLNNWSEIFEYMCPHYFVKMRHFWHHLWFYGEPIH